MKRASQRLYPFVLGAVFGAALMISAHAASAFETKLIAPNAPESLINRLRAASLVIAAQQEPDQEPRDILAMAGADYRRLVSVLYDHGYFGPVLHILVNGQEATTFPPFAPLNRINTVEIRVKTGPRFSFSRARLAPVAPDTELPEGFRVGQPALAKTIRTAAQSGVSGWRDAGYAKARVSDQDIRANHSNGTLSADLRLAPGPRVRFGALTLSGKSSVTDRRLRQIVSLPQGAAFAPAELTRISKRLRRTGVFRSVALTESDTVAPDGTMDIDVAVQDNKPHRFGFGAELESRDGVSVSAFWLHRNLLGGGESLRIEGDVSGIQAQNSGSDYRFSAELKRPATLGADTDLVLNATAERVNDPIYFYDKAQLRAGFTRILSETLTGSLGVQFEHNNVSDDYGDRSFTNIGLPLGLTYDDRDDPLDPSKGVYSDLTVLPYFGLKGGKSGAYFLSDNRGYRPVGDRLVLAGRVQIGTILGPSIADTPPDLLFLSGGGGTVRGQPYQSNYVTVSGIKSGGLSFIGLSGEARIKVSTSFSTVAFYDAGFIGETRHFTGNGAWHSGAGIGLRYHTTVGPIRVDLGAPVSGANSDGLQLYIGIGQAF